jgi:hypothetical protein
MTKESCVSLLLFISPQTNPFKVNLMSFHRSVSLSLLTLCTALIFSNLPVKAQEGELAAQDVNAQVNLRAEANTQAGIVATGKVGDRVEILSSVTGKDTQMWYRVKVPQSGQVGWVRGDLLKLLGASKTSAKGSPKAAAAAAAPKSKGAPVTLKAPKAVAKAQSVPNKTAAAAAAAAATSAAASTPEPNAAVAPAKAMERKTSVEETAIATPSVVIVSFQTPSYAVRVFSEAGQLRLNLFNRKSQQLVLNAVPVESKNSGTSTTYSYSSDLKVTVVVPTKGTPILTTIALGNTLQEEPQASPSAPDTAEIAPKNIPDQNAVPSN